MSDLLSTALKQAAMAAAARPDVPLNEADAKPVAAAIAAQMPAPFSLETLWPQMMRYGISGFGVALAARGIGPEIDWQAAANAVVDVILGQGDAADWQVIAGGIIAIAPPLWRIGATWLERRKVA